jgi:hypothetical protein
LVDIDTESIQYLHQKYPDLGEKIVEADYLKTDFAPSWKGLMLLPGIFLTTFLPRSSLKYWNKETTSQR